MGADMIISVFSEPHQSIDPKFKPDWKKGHDAIDKLTSKQLEETDYLADDDEDIKASLHEKLNSLQNAYENGSRELTTLDFPPYRVYLSGGMSWGDMPTEICTDISDLEHHDLIRIVGFCVDLPNYFDILKKILKQKTILPMLMSLDPDLDKMIAEQLKKRS